MIWFTSDTHFGHENVLKFTDRPWETIQQMNSVIVANINARVGMNDELYILGDFSFKMTAQDAYGLRKKITCKKVHLVPGNHDKDWIFQCEGVPPQADAWGPSPRVGGSHYVRTLGYRERVAPYQSERSERAADAMCVPTAQRVAGTPPQVQELGPLPPRLGADGRMVGWSAYAAGWRQSGPSRRNLAGFDGWPRGLWGFLVELLQWWCNHGTHPCRPPPREKTSI